MLNNNGALSEIALLLESCLSSHTTAEQVSNLSIDGLQDKPGSMEAKIKAGGEAAVWTLLGMVQAMDEKEAAAVRALEEGRKRFEAMGSKRNGPGGERSKLGDVMMGEGLVVSLRRGPIWSARIGENADDRVWTRLWQSRTRTSPTTTLRCYRSIATSRCFIRNMPVLYPKSKTSLPTT